MALRECLEEEKRGGNAVVNGNLKLNEQQPKVTVQATKAGKQHGAEKSSQCPGAPAAQGPCTESEEALHTRPFMNTGTLSSQRKEYSCFIFKSIMDKRSLTGNQIGFGLSQVSNQAVVILIVTLMCEEGDNLNFLSGSLHSIRTSQHLSE